MNKDDAKNLQRKAPTRRVSTENDAVHVGDVYTVMTKYGPVELTVRAFVHEQRQWFCFVADATRVWLVETDLLCRYHRTIDGEKALAGNPERVENWAAEAKAHWSHMQAVRISDIVAAYEELAERGAFGERREEIERRAQQVTALEHELLADAVDCACHTLSGAPLRKLYDRTKELLDLASWTDPPRHIARLQEFVRKYEAGLSFQEEEFQEFNTNRDVSFRVEKQRSRRRDPTDATVFDLDKELQ